MTFVLENSVTDNKNSANASSAVNYQCGSANRFRTIQFNQTSFTIKIKVLCYRYWIIVMEVVHLRRPAVLQNFWVAFNFCLSPKQHVTITQLTSSLTWHGGLRLERTDVFYGQSPNQIAAIFILLLLWRNSERFFIATKPQNISVAQLCGRLMSNYHS